MGAMTDKERFHAIMRFEPPDRPLYWEQGFWGGTIERWYAEGMARVTGVEGDPAYGDTVRGPATPSEPGDIRCDDAIREAGLDKRSQRVPVSMFLCPPFEERVLDDDGERIVIQDEMGIVKRASRDRDSIPQFIAWPVNDLDSFERLAADRLDPNTPERFPPNWAEQTAFLNAYDGVVALGGYPCGFFGTPRYLMGDVALLMGFLDRPALVKRIIDHLAVLWETLFDRVLSEVSVDCIHVWEDMSFKNGPLISPALFERFLVPAYARITRVASDHGVRVVLLDTDGDCSELIPGFLRGGVTGLYPFEVQAGMDVREIRRRYPRLQILGGIDKRRIAQGRSAIDAELERLLPEMTDGGGYIPMADHQIPPDVSWENYRYYRTRIAELCE